MAHPFGELNLTRNGAFVKYTNPDLATKILLIGSGERGGGATFLLSNVVVNCLEVEVVADRVRLHGRIWMEAEIISAPSHLQIHKNGSEVGWGGRFAQQFPWNKETATINAPYPREDADALTPLIRECSRRFPGGITLTLNPDYTPVLNDPQTRWIARRFASAFPTLIRVMHEYELASTDEMAGAGSGKVRVRFSVKWADFLNDLEHPHQPRLPNGFTAEARRQVG